MSGRYGSVGGEERRGAHDLQRFAERQFVALYQPVDAFDADKGRMSFVAVEDVGLYAKLVQCTDAAYAEQDFLPEAVLEVAAVEVVGDGAVFDEVQVVVGIEQVEFRAAYVAFPDAGRDVAAGKRDADRAPVAHVVAHGCDGELVEILRFITRLLGSVGREPLGEVTVTVEQTDTYHGDVLVARLLQVVARQDAEASRIDFQGAVQTVFHAEVGDARRLTPLFSGHVALEVGIDCIHSGEKSVVPFEFLQSPDVELVEKGNRIAVTLLP